MDKLMEVAKKLEVWINNKGFPMPSPDTLDYPVELWGLSYSGGFVRVHSTSYDIYELLETDHSASVARKHDAIGVVVYGHQTISTPYNSGKMRLVICANHKGMVTMLRLQNSPDELIIRKEKPLGSLPEAIHRLAMKAHRVKS